jgi:hypothetical protein
MYWRGGAHWTLSASRSITNCPSSNLEEQVANDWPKIWFYRKVDLDKNSKHFLATDIWPQARLFTLSVLFSNDRNHFLVVVRKLCRTHSGRPQSCWVLLCSTSSGCKGWKDTKVHVFPIGEVWKNYFEKHQEHSHYCTRLVCRVLGALGKAQDALGKGFAECNTRHKPLAKKLAGIAGFAECYLSGTRQSLCRVLWGPQ